MSDEPDFEFEDESQGAPSQPDESEYGAIRPALPEPEAQHESGWGSGRPEPLPDAISTPQTVALKENSAIPEGQSRCQIGILGPSESGKTYLFQGLVYRVETPGEYGVLGRYVKKNGVFLWQCSKPANLADPATKGHYWDLRKFNRDFKRWRELPATPPGRAFWYYLLLSTRTGWMGFRESRIKVTFIDCAGEEYQKDLDLENQEALSTQVWSTFEQARVMVFCLPIWAAFPGSTMKGKDWIDRTNMIEGFSQVLSNYWLLRSELRNRGRSVPRTRIVLALTQADDARCGLTTLRERWIDTYVANDRDNLRKLARISGPTKYLATARAVSDYVRSEFGRVADKEIRTLPGRLEIDGEQPWFIPVTAINGATLKDATKAKSAGDPVPAHIELPLLLALCDGHNILM